MEWPLYLFLFLLGSLVLSVVVTVVKVWLRKRLGREVRSTRRDSSYQRPF
jgi:ABC-type branched-subunit amino acid transport system permease subunit